MPANFDQIDDNALLFEQTLAKAHDVVHGDVNTSVETEGGILPSFRRYMSMLPPADKMVISFGASGPLSGRSAWDNASPGFTYLAENVGYVYTRLHAGGWSNGVSFRATQWTISTRNPLSVDGETSDVWLNKSTTELFTKIDASTWESRGNLSPGISDASVDNKSYVRKNGQWVELVSTDAAAISALQTAQSATSAALAAETQSRIDGETALTNTLEAYVNAAVTNNTNADNAETVARVAADNLIKGELDLSQASIGLDADGTFKAFTGTNYISAATTIANGIALIDTALKTENTRALAAESTASGNITTLTANLATEVTNRTNADTTLSNAISTINANATFKNTTNTFTKAQTVTPVALVDAATVNVDASLSNTFRITLAGNRTIANPTGMVDGQVMNFILKQDVVGSRTAVWGSKFRWVGGAAPTLTTAVSGKDVICCIYDGTDDVILANVSKGFA